MTHKYKTCGVCASQILFDLNDGIVSNVSFVGGCNGNLKAIAKLVDGMPASQVIKTLQGNTCGFKGTSCADQLAKALIQAISQNN